MDNRNPTTASSGTTTSVGAAFQSSGPVNITRTENLKIQKVWTLPFAFILAMTPTANVQVPQFFSGYESCTYGSDKKRNGVGTYNVYSLWYGARWEEIRVPQIKTVGHVNAKLKFQGALKWLPFQP
jgi:hypothetical protein